MGAPNTPKLAADVIIELKNQPPGSIVLIERKHPPLGWALPGGFVELDETVEAAAMREALEETGLKVRLTALLGVYSGPHRDPRGATASVVYVASASGVPHAMDDAKNVAVVQLGALPAVLAFDHARILADYARYRDLGCLPPPRDC